MYITQRKSLALLLIGLDGAGKTTFLEQLKTKYTKVKGLEPSQVIRTIGLNMCKFVYNGCDLTVWDLGGKKELQSIWQDYYECHGVIYVVDCENRSRLQESFDVLMKTMEEPGLSGTALLIIGNQKPHKPSSQENEVETQEKPNEQKNLKNSTHTHDDDDDGSHASVDFDTLFNENAIKTSCPVLNQTEICPYISIKKMDVTDQSSFDECLSEFIAFLKASGRSLGKTDFI